MTLFNKTKTKSRLKNLWWKSYIFIILAIIYIPLLVIVLLSFNGQTERGNVVINFSVPTFQNYKLLFVNNEFVNDLLNSLIVSVFVVPFSLIIAVLTCFGIWSNRSKNKTATLINNVSKISIAIPEPITAVSLAILFSSTWVAMGFNFGLFTVILAHISFCTPYAIIAIYPKMQKMNKNYLLASYDLGYNKTKTFFKVIIPYLLPAILSAGAIVFAMSIDDFIITNLINGSKQTISTAIYTARKGIKAWIVTFGAIVVMISLLVTAIVAIVKSAKTRTQKKDNRKDLDLRV